MDRPGNGIFMGIYLLLLRALAKIKIVRSRYGNFKRCRFQYSHRKPANINGSIKTSRTIRLISKTILRCLTKNICLQLRKTLLFRLKSNEK